MQVSPWLNPASTQCQGALCRLPVSRKKWRKTGLKGLSTSGVGQEWKGREKTTPLEFHKMHAHAWAPCAWRKLWDNGATFLGGGEEGRVKNEEGSLLAKNKRSCLLIGTRCKRERNSICAESKVKFVILEKKEICFLSSSKIFDRKWYCN